jgi:hypothetical protein
MDKIEVGHIVIYEMKSPNTGRKRTCLVSAIDGDWICDINHSNCFTQSFRIDDVIIWEHIKKRR